VKHAKRDLFVWETSYVAWEGDSRYSFGNNLRSVRLAGGRTATVGSVGLPVERGHDYHIRRSQQGRFAGLQYVPDEIIVKYHEEVADRLITARQKGLSGEQLALTDSLEALGQQYRVRKVEPVFRHFKEHRRRIEALADEDQKHLNLRERQLIRRLRRASVRVHIPALDRIYKLVLELQGHQRLEEAVASYRSDPAVEYAELNYIVSANLEANDPLYPLQWPLNNTGQDYPASGNYNDPPGTLDCDIDAPEAWDFYTGGPDVIVAVVDTGVDYRHRDINDNMWINIGEVAGNGIDDDDNGYVDDIYGYDFINNDSDPCDDRGHGTHCAGIIAAEGNTDPNRDIAGVCWIARIMALKFLGSDGYGSTSDAVSAFYYAVANGADVISNSWGGGSYSKTMKDAIDYAHSQGVIMVAAAGNDYSNEPQYPAAYEHMISVAATNSNDEKVPFSNYGDWVDIAAPGVDILSLRAEDTSLGTVYDDYTTVASGTSMACPHVAGACALLLSVNPLITRDEVYDNLIETVDPISPGICIADGRLNLHKAIAAVVPSQGYISFDRGYYACSGIVSVLLIDYDLRGQGTQTVNITTSGGDSETLLLTKDVRRPGIFTGTISIFAKHVKTEDGKLQVQHDQIITAIYEDANDGMGEPAVVTDTAVVDCIGPVVLDVQMGFPGREPRIFFETDEPATARVRCGLACRGPYIIEATSMHLTTSHSVKLVGMLPETEYFYIVEATDEAGNLTLEDNSGACYSFTTTGVTDIHVPLQCLTIQEAIDNSWDGGNVLVADGTYTGPGNRDIDFLGRAITVRSENEPENCIIDCNGTQAEPHRGFYFHSGEDANSAVEGFTIINGYAPDGQGGAIKCFESSPLIDNCIIRGNWAQFGGGVDNSYGSSPTLTDCVFQENSAEHWGGGMENWEASSPTLNNCTFSRNSADDGGGICNDNDSNPMLIDCTFIGNSTIGGGGGGMGNYYSSPTPTNCTFNGNSREGMYNYYSSATITNCTFSDNSGFGMGNADTSIPTVTGCTFNGNKGGGMKNGYNCVPIVTNCTFSGNKGYGMSNLAYNDVMVTNCTFSRNKGGIYNRYSTPILTNCILWDNGGTDESSQIYNTDSGDVIINYSCVQGWTDDLGGIGNIYDDPLFVEADGADNEVDTEDDNLRLLGGSPCIDAGDNDAPISMATEM
jgi:subtilisin family serine protease